MAAFNLSITLGGNTRSLNKTASAAHETRFVAALRTCFPQAADDNAAVDLFLNEIVAKAKEITLNQERAAATVANVNTIAQIDIT